MALGMGSRHIRGAEAFITSGKSRGQVDWIGYLAALSVDRAALHPYGHWNFEIEREVEGETDRQES